MSDMSTPKPSLLLFTHLVSSPDEEIDLAEAALVFAESEYPDLELGYYMALLDDLGGEARRILDARAPQEGMERVRACSSGSTGRKASAATPRPTTTRATAT